jgi:hypothetical protein
MMRGLRYAIVLPASVVFTAAVVVTTPPATHAWACAGACPQPHRMHHRRAPSGLRYQGTRAIPIFPFYGGCTDRGSPYWPCQTIPY